MGNPKVLIKKLTLSDLVKYFKERDPDMDNFEVLSLSRTFKSLSDQTQVFLQEREGKD